VKFWHWAETYRLGDTTSGVNDGKGCMKAKYAKTVSEVVLGREQFNRAGKRGPIKLTIAETCDVISGEVRYHVTVANAERLVFPDDFGVVLQCFGWGLANVASCSHGFPIEVWCGCCDVISKVEYCLKLN
jgi:hypothetical protein